MTDDPIIRAMREWLDAETDYNCRHALRAALEAAGYDHEDMPWSDEARGIICAELIEAAYGDRTDIPTEEE